MTSKQVMLAAVMMVAMVCTGCVLKQDEPRFLGTPYMERQVWAVAPLNNESGSSVAEGVTVADRLTQRLEEVEGLDVLPVNRVLSAMQTLGISMIASGSDLRQLRELLGVDGLVIGTITAFDPYDPPKIGLAIELYASPRLANGNTVDPGKLLRSPTDLTQPQDAQTPPPASLTGSMNAAVRLVPTSVVSGYYDAADPLIREQLRDYAQGRGSESHRDAWRMYVLSMDLYTEFVSYLVSSQLMQAEQNRLARTPPAF